jgi:stage V sporulation protein AC
MGLDSECAGTLTSVTLIFAAVLLTGFGVFDSIAKAAGAGTLVPITGFANAVAAPAIDAASEGYISGVGMKIFTVSGPVILYGTVAGTLYGVILYVCSLF